MLYNSMEEFLKNHERHRGQLLHVSYVDLEGRKRAFTSKLAYANDTDLIFLKAPDSRGYVGEHSMRTNRIYEIEMINYPGQDLMLFSDGKDLLKEVKTNNSD